MTPHRLYRSRGERMISGVAGGIAVYFDLDPTLVRLVWVILTIATGGLTALAYLLLWIIVPLEGQDASSRETVRSNVAEMAEQARSVASAAQEAVRGSGTPSPPRSPARGEGVSTSPYAGEGTHPYRSSTGWLGVVLVVIGLLFLVQNLGWFWWWRWSIFWPVVLIAVGVALLARRAREA